MNSDGWITISMHQQKVKALKRAQKSIGIAIDNVGYSMFLESALENIRLAMIQEDADYSKKMQVWHGKEKDEK